MSYNKSKCMVVTWFTDKQVGFLDFSYRIRCLSKHYKILVVSRRPIALEELHVPNADFVTMYSSGTGLYSFLRYLFSVLKLIRAHKPERIVILHSKLACLSLLIRKIPVAIYWNEHPIHFFPQFKNGKTYRRVISSIMRFLTYAGARRARCVMPIGEAHREELLASGCNAKKVRLIYMGVDQAFLPLGDLNKPIPVAPQKKPLHIIYIGTVEQARGRDVMIEAMALVNRDGPKARLTMVGARPEQQSYCLERAKELGVQEYINVLGRIPGYQIPSVLQTGDLGICLWEDRLYWRFNPPTKLFEYLVAGLPVLASNIRTHTQYILHWENGVIFEYEAESLAAAVLELWERRNMLPSLRKNAFKSGQKYIWDNIEPEFLGVVDQLVGCESFSVQKRLPDIEYENSSDLPSAKKTNQL